MRYPEQPNGTDHPGAALKRAVAAAQADAERRFGDGPVPVWRPTRAATEWRVAAGCAVLLAIVVGGWWAVGRADRSGEVLVVAAAGQPPLVTQPVAGLPPPNRRHTDADLDDAAATVPAVDIGPGITAREAVLPASIPADDGRDTDPDAWALHPGTGPVTAQDGFHGIVNTPDAPDENDATPADETQPDETQFEPAPGDETSADGMGADSATTD